MPDESKIAAIFCHGGVTRAPAGEGPAATGLVKPTCKVVAHMLQVTNAAAAATVFMALEGVGQMAGT